MKIPCRITGLIAIFFLLTACSLTVTTDLKKTESPTKETQQAAETEEVVEEVVEEATNATEETNATNEEPVPEPEPQQEPEQESEPEPEPESGEPEPEAAVESQRVIEVTVRNWEFAPAAITVKKGEKVTLKLVGESGVHGFAVPGLGLNVTVKPGEVTTVTLPTDTAGEYNSFCSIPCGPGHVDMQGTIVIEE